MTMGIFCEGEIGSGGWSVLAGMEWKEVVFEGEVRGRGWSIVAGRWSTGILVWAVMLRRPQASLWREARLPRDLAPYR